MPTQYREDTLPWYRQFWPWFLFGLPACVVVAGLTTVWIAIDGADDLVADDYYKSGLAINRQIQKQEAATSLGLGASVTLEGGGVLVVINQPIEEPHLALVLSHPLEADRDLEIQLQRVDARHYSAPLSALTPGRWHWILEQVGDSRWRLDGELRVAAD